jgi:hypothetical protein
MTHLSSLHPRFLTEEATHLRLPGEAPADPAALPTKAAPITEGSVHPGAIALALGGFGLFLAASWIGWDFGYMSLLLAVIVVLSAMYFGPLVGGGLVAAASRGETSHRSFGEFLTGRVQTLTGWVDGRDALIQIALMPILLGGTMSFFALLWLAIR